MQQFTQEELRNILAIINIAPIQGKEAMTVAMLQQKITSLLSPQETTPAPTEKEEK